MPLPSLEEILKTIESGQTPLTKRDLVKHFDITGDDRKPFKQMLRQLEQDNKIYKGENKAYFISGSHHLPSVTLIEITEIDADGDLVAVPVDWEVSDQNPTPRIEITSNTPMKIGDRGLAKLTRFSDRLYEGKIIRTIDRQQAQIIGQIAKTGKGFILKPIDKKAKNEFTVEQAHLNDAKAGDLVSAEPVKSRGIKNRNAKVIKILGHKDDVNAISLIALHEAGLTAEFPDKVEQAAQNLTVPPLGKREDLRQIPLITIDGADARDFDDAVFAEKVSNAEGGGFHLIVAIADVAHYVRPHSQIDKEAYKRGNSTYFPDRVVPMLPEALSNDMCSLNPHVDRAAMGFHLWIDDTGELRKYKVFRALIRSHARLTYEQVQAAKDGVEDDITKPLMTHVINPLYDAYAVLDEARQKRGALDLDLPERQIVINDKGKMTGVKKRNRLDAHKLIEEFMILANVAAAQALEAKNAPCIYRIHDRPSSDKLDSAREFLDAFGLSLPKGGVSKPKQINHLLHQASEMDYSHLISQVILRTQSQAIYHPENIGHFGLALRRYAHFTSPIRRYADLLVHRSLIAAYNLGEGGLSDEEEANLNEKAEHISKTERNSAEAERNAVDRFTAAWMSERIGAEFTGVINGVTRFGLFVTLDENGADGLVPMRSLPDDYYIHEETQHALIGRKSKRIYRLGAPVTIRLKEADGLTGSSVFEMANDDSADIPGITFKPVKPFKGDKKGKSFKRKNHKNKKKFEKLGKTKSKSGSKSSQKNSKRKPKKT